MKTTIAIIHFCSNTLTYTDLNVGIYPKNNKPP